MIDPIGMYRQPAKHDDRDWVRHVSLDGARRLCMGDAASAQAVIADYVALGPIYATTLKAMPWPPQGLPRLAEWRSRVGCPLVAIGGITLHRAPIVLAAGADSVAVITDFVTSQDPDARVENWIAATAPWRNLSTGLPQD